MHALGDMLVRARKANQEPKPREKKVPERTVNSTRKRMPMVESERKVLNLWFKYRQAQTVGPNAAAVDSSSYMACKSPKIPPERMWGGPGTVMVSMRFFVENQPRQRLVPLEIHH